MMLFGRCVSEEKNPLLLRAGALNLLETWLRSRIIAIKRAQGLQFCHCACRLSLMDAL